MINIFKEQLIWMRIYIFQIFVTHTHKAGFFYLVLEQPIGTALDGINS